MAEHLGVFWRTAATGLCFAGFGVAALLARLLMFPLLPVLLPEPEQRTRWTKRFVRRSFLALIGLMKALGLMTYELRGAERLQRNGLLILANHPSFIDVVFLMAFVRRADCIIKASLASNPFTRSPVLAAGYQFNDSGAALLDNCVQSMRAGNNLIIFPEGTRTPRHLGGARPVLQRGAANIAVRGRLNVTPVRISVEPLTLGKGDKWYQVPPRRWHLCITVGDDLAIAPILAACQNEALAARRLNEVLGAYWFPSDTTHEFESTEGELHDHTGANA